MTPWLNNRSIGAKLASIIALLVGGLLLIGAVALIVSKRQMMEERKAFIRGAVDIAVGYADAAKADVAKGLVTREEAIRRFLSETGAARYNNGIGYFFAYDANTGVYLVNPSNPKSVGTDGTKVRDPKGRYFIRDSLEPLRRDGATFYDLEYPRPGTTNPVPKLNYAKLVPDWNVIVVSGVFIDDITAALWEEAETLAPPRAADPAALPSPRAFSSAAPSSAA